MKYKKGVYKKYIIKSQFEIIPLHFEWSSIIKWWSDTVYDRYLDSNKTQSKTHLKLNYNPNPKLN